MELPDYIKAKKRTKEKVEKELYELDDSLKKIGSGKKYFLKTYGCQMNEHDSENIKAMLEELSFVEVDNYKDADLVLLNTCSIRENAHNKAFGMLGRLIHIIISNTFLSNFFINKLSFNVSPSIPSKYLLNTIT